MRRLKRHFEDIVAALRVRDLAHLGEQQRMVRRSLLDELAAYGRRGRFPRNLDFGGGQMPYFVDAAGTRCAVAHLVETTGEQRLVQRIARTRNNAFVRELAGDAELGAWAARAGFTLEELGRIQPSYCDTAAAMCFCGSRSSAAAGVEGTVVAMDSHPTVRIDAVIGDTSLATVGSELVSGDATEYEVGDEVIGGIDPDLGIYHLHRVVDGMVDTGCGPDLTKEEGLAAIMAEVGCPQYLTTLDEAWGDEECSSKGCSSSTAAPLAVPPLVCGVCAVALGVWAHRRRLRHRKAKVRAECRRVSSKRSGLPRPR